MSSFVRLLVVSGLTLTTVHAIRPMATYRALTLDAGPFEIGLLLSAYAGLSLLVAVPAGRWIDRVGEAHFLIVGCVLLALSSLSIVWINNIPLLVASQAALGLGHILILIAGQTMVANRTARAQRDQRFGFYSVSASLGQLVGPALAGIVAGGAISAADPSGALATDTVFLVGAALTALAVIVSLTLLRGPEERHGSKEAASAEGGYFVAAGRILRRPTMVPAMLVSIAVILCVDLIIAYLPAYGEERGLSVQLVSALLSIRAGSSIASRLAMGRLIARFGHARVLLGSMTLACVALLGFLLTDDPLLLIGLMVLTGIGLGFGQPMTISWVASGVPRALRATALGVRLTGNRLGVFVIPSVIGLVAGTFGLGAVFGAMALFLGGGGALVLHTKFEEAAPD